MKSRLIQNTLPRGFTLIEMVMVLVILGVLAAIAAPIFSQGLAAARVTSENLRTLGKLRYATERLAREIRQVNYSGGSYDINSKAMTSLVFVKDDSSNPTVSITGSGGNITLAYSTPAVTAVLTDEVSGFSLTYYDGDGIVTTSNIDLAFVEISLSLQNAVTGASFSQRTRIALRDKS